MKFSEYARFWCDIKEERDNAIIKGYLDKEYNLVCYLISIYGCHNRRIAKIMNFKINYFNSPIDIFKLFINFIIKKYHNYTSYSNFKKLLIRVCYDGHTDVVDLILDYGDENSLTLFIKLMEVAGKNGHTDIVKLVLDYGIKYISNFQYSINRNNINNNAPICKIMLEASKDGYKDIILLLLDYINNEDIYYSTLNSIIENACENGHIDIVYIVLNLFDKNINILKYYYNKYLKSAIINGHIDIVRLLLENADKNCNPNINLALNYAINYNHVEIVKFLLDKGADLNFLDMYSPVIDSNDSTTLFELYEIYKKL